MAGNASPGFHVGWNWPAFASSTRWFFRHGMYGWMALNLAGTVIVALPVLVEESWAWYLLGGYLILSYGVLPAIADWLLARHLASHLKAAGGNRFWTALGSWAIRIAWMASWLVIVGAGVLAFSDDPHYRRVSIGSALATQFAGRIQEFYDKHRRYPDAAEAATLTSPDPHFFGDIAWDPGEKRIVVTFKVGPIQDKHLIIHSREHQGALQWKCSYDLPERFGRRACLKSVQ